MPDEDLHDIRFKCAYSGDVMEGIDPLYDFIGNMQWCPSSQRTQRGVGMVWGWNQGCNMQLQSVYCRLSSPYCQLCGILHRALLCSVRAVRCLSARFCK